MQFTNRLTGIVLGTIVVGAVAGAVVLTKTPQPAPASTTQLTAHAPTKELTLPAPPVTEQLNPKRLATGKAKAQPRAMESVTRNPLPKAAVEQWAKESLRAKKREDKAKELLKQGRLAEAEEACYRALALSPKINGEPFNMNALQLLGDVRFAQGKYQEAIQTYNRAREHTRNLELDFGTALAYMKLNDMESARKYFNVNKYYDVKKYSKSRTQSAAEIRAEQVAQLPEDKTAKGFEANIYIARAGDKLSYAKTEEALKDYQKALQMFSHNERAMTRCAVLLRRLKRYDESLKMWARVAAFGTGKVADKGRFEVRQWLAPDKAEQMIRAAKNSG